MKARLASSLPYMIAVILPLAGVFLALWRFTEGERQDALYILLLSLAAGLVWWLALASA